MYNYTTRVGLIFSSYTGTIDTSSSNYMQGIEEELSDRIV